MKKNIIIVSAILYAGIAFSATAQAAAPKPIGGDKDSHGCLTAAGYSWNEAKKDCTRSWEDAKVSTGTPGQIVSSAARAENIRKQITLTIARLNAAIDRVKTLADRTESRILKLSTEKVNVSVSRKFLADARVKLDEARAKVAITKAAADAALTASPSKNSAAMKKVDAYVKDTSSVIRDAEKLVSRAISNLKPGSNKPK